MSSSARIHRQPISYVRALRVDGTEQRRAEVACPHLGISVPVDVCARCPRFGRIEVDGIGGAETLVCSTRSEVAPDARLITLRRASVAEIMTRAVVCVQADVSLDAATALFLETGLRSLPVVDAEGRLLGFVTESDVVLEVQLGRAAHAPTVADVMSCCPLWLRESATVGTAAALLAAEGEDRLAVVGEGGRLVGVVATTDVLGWLARAEGHSTLPARVR